jgi:hypothetical protein
MKMKKKDLQSSLDSSNYQSERWKQLSVKKRAEKSAKQTKIIDKFWLKKFFFPPHLTWLRVE